MKTRPKTRQPKK